MRLFQDYQAAEPDTLAARVAAVSGGHGDGGHGDGGHGDGGHGDGVTVGVDLSGLLAHDALPRWQREPTSAGMRLTSQDGVSLGVPLAYADGHGRRFGELRDRAGRRAYIFRRPQPRPGSGARVGFRRRSGGSMPGYLADRCAAMLRSRGRDLAGTRTMLLGVTYKHELADLRASPAYAVARELTARSARLVSVVLRPLHPI